jgi:hypothetical protein
MSHQSDRAPRRGQKDGDEVDAFSPWRRVMFKRAGKFSAIKTRASRRERRIARQLLESKAAA